MDMVRIGHKIISRQKINKVIDEALQLRQIGLSQTDVAARIGIDRSFLSRLENIGEIRKGKSIAVIGFPILNKNELQKALLREGVDLLYLFTEEERWSFVKNNTGLDLFNTIMQEIAKVHACDQVIVIGSNKRIKLMEAVLDKEVIAHELGQSPIREDKYVNPDEIMGVVKAIKRGQG